MPFIVINHFPIHYRLRRSLRAKRLHLICRETYFEMVAPPRIKNKEALIFLWSHQRWILKQHQKRAKRQSAITPLVPLPVVTEPMRSALNQSIQSILQQYCTLLGRWPTTVRVKKQKTRWGSCGIHDGITINEKLIFAPAKVLEYVVVHELCHLWHRNHGKRFWAKVESVMPDYMNYDRWLSREGRSLLSEYQAEHNEFDTAY